MKEKKKIYKELKRKVHIKGKEWTYDVKKSYLKVCNPSRTQKYTIKLEGFGGDRELSEETGIPISMGTFYKEKTPANIKKIIQKEILKEEVDDSPNSYNIIYGKKSIKIDNLHYLKGMLKLCEISEEQLDEIDSISKEGSIYILTNPYDREFHDKRTLVYSGSEDGVHEEYKKQLIRMF